MDMDKKFDDKVKLQLGHLMLQIMQRDVELEHLREQLASLAPKKEDNGTV